LALALPAVPPNTPNPVSHALHGLVVVNGVGAGPCARAATGSSEANCTRLEPGACATVDPPRPAATCCASAPVICWVPPSVAPDRPETFCTEPPIWVSASRTCADVVRPLSALNSEANAGLFVSLSRATPNAPLDVNPVNELRPTVTLTVVV